ncbi:hypothetical protein EYF80_057693 [Liparis tanakae]|uniref:Uncharacterized protein n=1 Tax=Liparis tanakae TaxID=230148 RepID=A0A4Z2ETN0_9TELE|nr:hypothetical protein EYF80_057693 [Liparis tanakae]
MDVRTTAFPQVSCSSPASWSQCVVNTDSTSSTVLLPTLAGQWRDTTPRGSLGDEGTTLERSSQAPAACSASVWDIRLVMSVSVNLFCLDQMLNALLKYRLETRDKKQCQRQQR